MYLRVSKQKRADGSQIAHLQFAESTWDPAKKRSQVRILYNFGRAEDPAVVERLRRLATSILKRVAPEQIVAQDAQWQLVEAWPYGDL
ncbi:MAG: transposase, partial [Sulfitobacter sp.]|nr:transposase [Sulfitobacter sp.]